MKVSRQIDEASGLVTLTVNGKVTYEGIIKAYGEMLGDPRFRKGASNLWDFRNADGDTIAGEDIQSVAALVETTRKQRGEGYKVAFVVARDVDYGIARMYDGYAGRLPFEVMVFRSMDDALKWIRM